jgi:hypothetical protein
MPQEEFGGAGPLRLLLPAQEPPQLFALLGAEQGMGEHREVVACGHRPARRQSRLARAAMSSWRSAAKSMQVSCCSSIAITGSTSRRAAALTDGHISPETVM